jgi:hypothetical protein
MKTDLEKLAEAYEIKANGSYYNQGAYLVADYLGLKMKVGDSEYRKYFPNDKESRYVFKITLKKGGKQYTFNFGQSIAEGSNEPTLYGVLTCLQKYDVGTFEDFCRGFGYDEDSKTAERTYKAVIKEFEAMQRLFTDEELEVLQIIQ